MATFEQAVEELYAEAWEANLVYSGWADTLKKKEVDAASSDLPLERIEAALQDSLQRSSGASKALGRVLALRGDVGTREFMQGRRPEPRQTWARLMEWAIAKGFETQEEFEATLAEHEQHRVAAANLGKNYEEYQDQIPSVRSLVEQ